MLHGAGEATLAYFIYRYGAQYRGSLYPPARIMTRETVPTVAEVRSLLAPIFDHAARADTDTMYIARQLYCEYDALWYVALYELYLSVPLTFPTDPSFLGCLGPPHPAHSLVTYIYTKDTNNLYNLC